MSFGIDLDLGLEGTHVCVTGGRGLIGATAVTAFAKAGCFVSVLDLKPFSTNENDRICHYQVDISDGQELERCFDEMNEKWGVVQVCIALAGLDLSYLSHHSSIIDLPLKQWEQTFKVNVRGTFLTSQLWLKQIKKHAEEATRNVSLVIVGSESGTFGEQGNPDYASGKSAVQVGLLHSLKSDVVHIHPRAR